MDLRAAGDRSRAAGEAGGCVTRVELHGRYAVGEHRYAIVDDDMLAFLSQWRWKAKINGSGSGVYAVRNETRNGICRTIRMHRVILGMGPDDPREVDHINGQPLDNRRANLRPATRQENARNLRQISAPATCKGCGSTYQRTATLNGWRASSYCSPTCRPRKQTSRPPSCTVHPRTCMQCGIAFMARDARMVYCTDLCRYRYRNGRGNRSGTLDGPVSIRVSAASCFTSARRPERTF